MADKPPEMPPQSDPFPGSRTPGWNDPPTLHYNPQSAGASAGRPRLNLNKRVAFPLQGTAGGGVGAAGGAISKPTAIVPPNQASYGSGLPPMSLPGTVGAAAGTSQPIAVVHPMPNMNATPPVSRVSATDAATRSTAVAAVELPADAMMSTMRALRTEVPRVRESPNVRREEIERRLGIVEQLWESGNLSALVQEKLYQLANAIADKNYNTAMETYTALVTNHANECATWAVSLRHVVLTLQPALETSIESIATATTATATIENSSSSNSNIAVVPAMYVPAMPRQAAAAEANSTINNTVQHI